MYNNFFWDCTAKYISAKITGVTSDRFWSAPLFLFAIQPCKSYKNRTVKGWAGTPDEKTWLKEVNCDNLVKHLPLYRDFNIMLLPDSLIHLLNCSAGVIKIRIKVVLQWIVNGARNSSKNEIDWEKTTPMELNSGFKPVWNQASEGFEN